MGGEGLEKGSVDGHEWRFIVAPGTGKQCPVWQPFGHRQTGRAVSQSELSVGLTTQMKPGKRRTLKAVYGTYRQRFVMDENSFGVNSWDQRDGDEFQLISYSSRYVFARILRMAA